MIKCEINNILLIGLLCIFIFIACMGCGSADELNFVEEAENDEPVVEEAEKKAEQSVDPLDPSDLDADYYIDYENGTIPLSSISIGARVVDPTWQWNYLRGTVKPVTWIVVAIDHYNDLDPHATLVSEELIGLDYFDNSGNNHWGESGTGNATRGLRPWLNSTGIHTGEGFYRAFSESFKKVVLTTTVPNKDDITGSTYSTNDNVFIPTITELGDTLHNNTNQIGSAYPYFYRSGDEKRVAKFHEDDSWYWTRSPSNMSNSTFHVDIGGGIYSTGSSRNNGGVRPALNLKSDVMVTEIMN